MMNFYPTKETPVRTLAVAPTVVNQGAGAYEFIRVSIWRRPLCGVGYRDGIGPKPGWPSLCEVKRCQ
jgi:hypothetical protein